MPIQEPVFADELRQRVDEVLHYLWDPIGVSRAPTARDEYCRYVAPALDLLYRRASGADISKYLLEIESEGMGLSAQPQRALAVAELLVRWHQTLEDRSRVHLQG
jgi:hypothetical protein